MDIHCKFRYTMGHETPRNPSTAGGTEAPRHDVAPCWQDISIGGRDLEFLHKLAGALGSELSGGWGECSAAQACVGKAAAVVTTAEAPTAGTPETGGSGSWIHNGFVDPAAHCETDRAAFWNPLPPGPRLAGDGEFRMDVAETGTPGHPERRGSHRRVEEIQVAAYKKKPKDLEPISPSSTKAASSSFLTCARPGRRSDRPRSSDTATGVIGSPPSPLSPSLPAGYDLAFISASTAPTSRVWRSWDSCAICFGICGERWCCFGMEAPSTNASSSRTSCASITGFMSSLFLPTLQNSTRTNSSGPRLSAPCPMACPRISPNSDATSAVRSMGFETPRNYFGPAFTPLIYHGRNRYIH